MCLNSYTKQRLKDQDVEDGNVPTLGVTTIDWSKRKLKIIVIVAFTLLTSSQSILFMWSKRNGKCEYGVTTTNFMADTLICGLSVLGLARIWRSEGVTEDNRLSTTLREVIVYPIPAFLYLLKNLLEYYILEQVDAETYDSLKILSIISTGVFYRIILKKKLSKVQWTALILLYTWCCTVQLKTNFDDDIFRTPIQVWVMAIVMALLSGFAEVYTEAIMKKRPSRNINVQNFWLYIFGMMFNAVAIVTRDFDAVMKKGFFYGYSFIIVLMILNHALSGLAVSMVMKYADNMVKVYSTSVAMVFTEFASLCIFGLNDLTLLINGTIVTVVCAYLHVVGKRSYD